MAKIKFSAFMTDMRGKIGGTVFSRNSGGAYSKNKVTPSNPKTIAQQLQRQLMSAFAQAWRSLTQGQRDSWVAGAPNFPLTNIFGDTYTLAGNMLFNRFNLNLSKIGQPTINDCPTPEGIVDRAISDLTATAGTIVLDITDAIPANMTGLVLATAPLSAGVTNYSNKLRVIGTIDNSFGNSGPIQAMYSAKFGVPPTGTRIGVSLLVVNNSTGEEGVPTKFDTIVS